MTEDDSQNREAQKDEILDAALMHIAFDGWGRKSLLNAARDLEIDTATAQRLFPQGGRSLLHWFEDWADRQMIAAIDAESLAKMPVRQRIAELVSARFDAISHHKESLRRAVSARLMPSNVAMAGRDLWRTTARIWAAAGIPIEREQGVNRYSRRATLGAVLLSTFFFWIEDQSEDHKATRAFLDRRINDVMRFGKLTQAVTRWRDFLPLRRQRSA